MSVAPEPAPGTARTSHQDDFDAVYLQFWPQLLRHALRLHGWRDAEEIAQETMARGFRDLDLTRSPGEIWTWLSRVSHNVAADIARRRRLCDVDGSSLEQTESRETFLPDASAILTEQRRLVRAAMSGLTERQQHMLLLHELDGLTCDQIAKVHGVTEHCVRKTLQRSRAVLARKLRALRDPAALLVPWPLIHSLSRRLRPARGVALAAGVAGAALMSTLVLINPGSAAIGMVADYESSSSGDGSLTKLETSDRPPASSSQRRHRGPASARHTNATPNKLVAVPKTPLSPGQRTYLVIDVPTPLGTVHVEEELATDPSGGLLCNSPVADCR